MDCPIKGGKDAAADLIVGFCAGSLDPATLVAFERHLEHCTECSAQVLAQRSLWQALDQLPAPRINPDFDEKVFQRIAQEEALGILASHRLLSWRHALPLAAACVALGTAVFMKSPEPTQAPPVTPPQAVQIEQVEHALDDLDMLKQMGFENVGNADAVKPI